MWTLITTKGQRVDGIRREEDARYAVQTLGITEAIGPYSWQVLDNRGERFVAELRKAA